MPFWEFIGATMAGKALVKVQLSPSTYASLQSWYGVARRHPVYSAAVEARRAPVKIRSSCPALLVTLAGPSCSFSQLAVP